MKILISAYACNPYLGSENYFGWSAVTALARNHDLWVLTGWRNQSDLQRAIGEGRVAANIRFVFAGEFQPWHPNRLRARLQGWREYVHFSSAIMPLARQLHQVEKFDLAHHVTFATWRVASPLWRLDIPLVFGPVGGNEQFPLAFLPMLSPAAMIFEILRMASNAVSQFSPGVRRTIRQSGHVFVANVETEKLVKTLRNSANGMSNLMATFHSTEKINAFSRFVPDEKPDGPLQLFAGGNMEGRKGAALALAALARVKKAGIDFCYLLASGGPEITHLKQLAARLDLSREVIFADNLHGEDYQRKLGATHVYLLPSLRDSAPITLTEAMLAGCVPVVADCGGPGFMVTKDCGYKIPIVNREQMVAQLATAILELARDRKIISEKGRAARERIIAVFAEENYLKAVNAVYSSLI